ncbi:MAG: DUF4956 domain-containing protein, partial [Prevotella sp.]|nr:DUF4956 domain-containing protein [Prevotella sp.]
MELITSILTGDFTNALLRFFICIVVNWVIIDRMYFRKSHRRDFYFTFMLISVVIFFLVFFMMGMERGKATMGVGLGLFGIFSIMRYRTDSMPVREMTYLFIIVCLSVVHAMVDVAGLSVGSLLLAMAELLVVDIIVVAVILLCEKRLKLQATKLIQYDRIELIKPEKYEELKADLEGRLGIKILKVEVGGVDFLKDTAVLRVTYDGKSGNEVDSQFKVRKSQWRDLRCLLPVALLFMVATPALAQSDDFGIWTEASLEKKVNSWLSVDAGLELRTRDDGFGDIDRWSFNVGGSVKLLPWLKASLGYTLIDDNNHRVNTSGKKYADYWGLRHRVNLSLTASQQFGRFTASLRERWQYTYRPEQTVDRYWNIDDDDHDYGTLADTHVYSGKATNKWRQRLQLRYKATKQWRPFVSVESTIGGSGLDKMRYAVGTELRIDKQNSFDFSYMYQHSYKDGDNEGNRHVLGLGYTF